MGMYDSVIFPCPHCDGEVEAQSKAGECSLRRIEHWKVPKLIAEDIVGQEVRCLDGCKKDFQIQPEENVVRFYNKLILSPIS